MKKLIKDALILFLITLVAGAALGAVYAITKHTPRFSPTPQILQRTTR